MIQEQWKDIKGYEGIYQVSNMGYVRNIKSKKDLKAWHNHKGYMKVALSKNGEKHEKFVHRLVAENFIDNPNNLPQVNHINGNKDHNYIENLEWCTCKENIKHCYEHNLVNAERRANSRRDNHNVVYKGETMSLSKFSRISGIGRHKAYNLLKKGYSINDILTTKQQNSN